MGRKPAQLNEKHWQALALIEEGSMSLKDIAKTIGWSADYLYDLKSGNIEKAREVAGLFQSEIKKLDQKRIKKIKDLTNENKELALAKINEYLNGLKKKSITDKRIGALTSVMNALTKATPAVEIGSVNFYAKGLTAEELIHEYKRLTSIARCASDREGVSESKPSGTRRVSKPVAKRSRVSKKPKDT